MKTLVLKKELWEWWEPNPLTREYRAGDICYYGINGLFVTFYGDKEPVTFIFNKGIEYFRAVEEGSILSVFNDIEFKDEEVPGFCTTGNFIVENSRLKEEIIKKEKGVTWEPDELIHFRFSTDDGVFDVLSYGKPILKN